MIIGRVVGNVWATRKEEVLVGIKFLVVQPHGPDGKGRGNLWWRPTGWGAGLGDMVIVTQGSSARLVYGEQWPIDAAVIGIVDSVEKGG
ncbi:EutN/CcmL family microcompartment protein [Kyrpidia spormannii]|uniref:Carbon dioxide concentrating mechanism protein CcmL n=1 Tax=Kyrpidia spormannii TaxID=2055160 RepID=A0ACA8ZBN6_9BACL|nr:EutN/CcmL family microcompartment protein [Kyrpidia spormannii]CAB3394347.1 Carbon dioxide concentrating mechanism protein CcmL [Kyrpidia spormannii]